MREILFRGKIAGTDGWIYGLPYAVYTENDIDSIQCAETKETEYIRTDTLGQYTGLKDKNGKMIYEGDIVSLVTECETHLNVVCEFGSAIRDIYGNEVEIIGFYFRITTAPFKKTFPIVKNYLGKHDCEIFEIIGNIHDNPDILKTINLEL